MKYEFHVGNYVETVGGFVGWISVIRDGDYIIITDNANNTCGYYIPQEIKYFKRIGQYDFTKPEQPKEIKNLPDGYGDGYVLYKGVTEVDGTVENGWVSIGVLSSKINELVDAVNELRDK